AQRRSRSLNPRLPSCSNPLDFRGMLAPVACFAALGAVEDHPGGKVLAEVLEPVLDLGRHEEQVAGAERGAHAPVHELPRTADNDVDLVARVRLLPVHFARLVDFDLERTVAEETDELPAGGSGERLQ